MAKPELTKQLLATTLKKLMKEIPLDKISVQEIVDSCGLNRKTFYYHFQDKQALVCWIFDQEYASLTDLNQNDTIIDELITHLYTNKDFYVAALTSKVQNNLQEHMFKVVYDGIIQKIRLIPGSDHMVPKEMNMIANYFAHALMGSITEWARDGMKSSPYEEISNFYPITQECLEYIVKKYENKKRKPAKASVLILSRDYFFS